MTFLSGKQENLTPTYMQQLLSILDNSTTKVNRHRNKNKSKEYSAIHESTTAFVDTCIEICDLNGVEYMTDGQHRGGGAMSCKR